MSVSILYGTPTRGTAGGHGGVIVPTAGKLESANFNFVCFGLVVAKLSRCQLIHVPFSCSRTLTLTSAFDSLDLDKIGLANARPIVEG